MEEIKMTDEIKKELKSLYSYLKWVNEKVDNIVSDFYDKNNNMILPLKTSLKWKITKLSEIDPSEHQFAISCGVKSALYFIYWNDISNKWYAVDIDEGDPVLNDISKRIVMVPYIETKVDRDSIKKDIEASAQRFRSGWKD